MKHLSKKITSFMLALVMAFSLSIPAFASENFEILSLTEADIQNGIEQALQMKLAEVDNIAERNKMEYAIRENLENIDISNIQSESISSRSFLGDIWKAGLPDIHIENTYVAATIDTILNGILIASGVGTLTVALKKYGAKQLQYMFINTIKTKVIGKAAIALGISLPGIANYLNYALDPAGKMAEYLDSKDEKPNNGYLDIIW